MKWFAVLLGLALAGEALPQSLTPVDRSTKVTVSPERPIPSDDISVTISRWVEGSWKPGNLSKQTLGSTIRMDLHWELVYTLVAVPPHCEEYTVSLGRWWTPGRYAVIVTNYDDGQRKDSGFANFTVGPSGVEPSSWAGSLVDALFGNVEIPDSSGDDAIDRLLGLLDESALGDEIFYTHQAWWPRR